MENGRNDVAAAAAPAALESIGVTCRLLQVHVSVVFFMIDGVRRMWMYSLVFLHSAVVNPRWCWSWWLLVGKGRSGAEGALQLICVSLGKLQATLETRTWRNI